MDSAKQTDAAINALLGVAVAFREAAARTAQPAYRAKMLNTARQLEAEAAARESA